MSTDKPNLILIQS